MIGIIDWGVGGFGLVKELKRKHNFNYIYFSDSGYTPYGKVEEKELKQRVEKVINFLKNKGATKIIIACNAAGSVITDHEVINIVSVGKDIISKYPDENLTIIGGNRIIESKLYDLGLNHNLKATQRLSAIVEAGEIDKSKNEITQIVSNLGQINKLFLGCTHYPALISVISENFPQIKFIDPAVELAQKLEAYLSFQKTNDEIFTTGSKKQLIKSTKLAFDITLDPNQVQKISL